MTAMRYPKVFAVFAATMLAVTACIYPFDPVIEGEDERLVVEGDIHLGSASNFKFSRIFPLDWEGESMAPPQIINGYIEGEDGTKVGSSARPDSGYGQDYGSSSLHFDTSGLKSGQRYRLHFEDQESGAVYESDWIEVCPPPVIDDLSYILDDDRGELKVALSMHCNGRSHFRWHYDEVWEYRADAMATCYYNPVNNMVEDFPEGVNIFYCWSRYNSPDIKIFSTEDQVDDRFVDLEFHRISRSDKRLQVLYQIKVYLEDDFSRDDARELETDLKKMQGVEKVTFVPKEEAMEIFKERLGDQKSLLEALDETNPLPDSFEVMLKQPEMVKTAAENIERLEGVEMAKYGQDVMEHLFDITRLIRIFGFALMFVLALATLFIIANTIRLTVFARRKEIAIMKYVGATDWFIRWPFVLEGMVMGLLGSVIASLVLRFSYSGITAKIYSTLAFLPLIPEHPFLNYVTFVVIIGGMFMGAVGSAVSIKRFLKV